MKMNKLNILLAGVLLLWMASCSQGMLEEVPQPETQTPADAEEEGRRTVELLIQNNLQVNNSTATRADAPIATTAENEITAMDIYVFGSLTEHGKYTYQERLCYRADETVEKKDDIYPFVLVPSAANTAVSTARISIKKGLYVKLYCVANQSTLYILNNDKHAYEPAEFKALKQTAPGNENNQIETEGIPAESDFLTKHVLHVINPTDETDVIHTPLSMVGDIAGCIDLTDINENSRLNVSMKLRRAVARFDVINDKEKSRLEITEIGMVGGNATTSLFPYTGQGDAQGNMIDYPVRKFLSGTPENAELNGGGDGLKSAYYTYAAPDQAELTLNGTYTTPSNEVIKVSYRVPFSNVVNGNGTKVTINPNHRYTVKVNDADAYQVKLSITVADWEDGGSLDDYLPDNAIKITGTVSSESNTQFSSDKTWAGVKQDASTGTTLFTYTLESNSELTHELVYFGEEVEPGTGWLGIEEQKQTISSGALNSYKYIYTIKKQNPSQPSANSYPTATILFKNKVGTVLNLVVQPRPMSGGYYANLVGDYWVAVPTTSVTYNSPVTLASAKQACTGEWRLPTMNEWHEIVRSDKDWNHYLTPGTDAFYTFFEGDDAGTTRIVDESVKTNLFNVSGTYAGLYASWNFWSADASRKTPANNLCLKTGNISSGEVSYTSVAATGTAYVRCIKNKQK